MGGDSKALEVLDYLFAENPVDVSGRSESFTQALKLRKGSEISYLSTDTVTVTVEIEPMIISRTFENVKVGVTNLSSGLKYSLAEKTVDVSVTGPKNEVDVIKSAKITASMNLWDVNEPGEYSVAPSVFFSGDSTNLEFAVVPAEIKVIITAK